MKALTERLPAGLSAVPLGVADAPAAAALSAEAGWNQTAADWRLMMTLGEAIGVRDAGGRLAASALALPFDGPFAWISMVLVTAAHRRRGIATALMAHCMTRIGALGLVPVLDATDAGRRVYGPLGFQPVHGLQRLRAERIEPGAPGPGRRHPPGAPGPGRRHPRRLRTERIDEAAPRADVTVRPIEERDWVAIEALDRRAFGAGRMALLRHLGARRPARAMVASGPAGVAGFVLARDGREALQVGPVVAGDPATAAALTAAALTGAGGPVCVDAIEGHGAYAAWLADAGFVTQRGFTRMILGRRAPFGDPGLVYAAAGPELG